MSSSITVSGGYDRNAGWNRLPGPESTREVAFHDGRDLCSEMTCPLDGGVVSVHDRRDVTADAAQVDAHVERRPLCGCDGTCGTDPCIGHGSGVPISRTHECKIE